MDIIPFKNNSYTKYHLSALTGPALVDIHNEIAKSLNHKPVNKFVDKTTAIDRVWKLLTKTQELAMEQEPKPVTTKKVRGKHFKLPFSGTVKPLKDDNSLRTRVAKLLLIGGTFEQVKEVVMAFDNDRNIPHKNVDRRAYEVVRILHYVFGYGVMQDENNVIYLTGS